ncbi:MFS transporter [Mycobacterium sp. 1423905.2]|uniref:MFS transporter n=1 Tax=Mycobacterium sp. 1423905.2 TaxID=1856859 RepID=UPI0007FD68C8|nr:MFS transporter [Mycobacterium sp. 1423905.2]OBJ47365.1 MFS transporter [Mycobacterium sp. 1423905.2]
MPTGSPPAVNPRPAADNAVFGGVLAVLLAIGWAANHFAALMPVISEHQHLSAATLNAVFGVYAIGLLPGLLIGGRLSDALGRQSVAYVGAASAVAGTVAMLVSQHSAVLLAGRLIVGVGVGLAISSGTAWASDLKGPGGAATAGAVLIGGFAIGPFAAGIIGMAGQRGVEASFLLAAALVVAGVVVAVLAAQRATAAEPVTMQPPQESAAEPSTARALSWAMPLAPWVFASATLAFVTIPTRLHTELAAPVAAGTAALIANGASGLIQVLARRRRWGPQTGTAGALLAAVGYAATAAAPPTMTVAIGVVLLVVLGCASGLCLREGLIDLEAAAPKRVRGAVTGAFYSVTYIGFGLPLLLTTIKYEVAVAILGVMAVLATVSAVSRAVRLRRDNHRQP